MPGPAKGTIRLTQSHRDKISKSKILQRLINHAEGKEDMTKSEVSAGLGLLKKALPDLASVTISGDPDAPLVHTIERRIVRPHTGD